MAHGGVNRRREKKAHADFFDGAARGFGRQIHANAERFENIRGAAVGADRAIAVFCDAHACACHYESRSGRNIECAARVAAGAAGVDQRLAGREFAAVRKNWRGMLAHYFGEADQLIDCLAFHAQ